MPRTIRRYELSRLAGADHLSAYIPDGAVPLSAGRWDGVPTVWALVDPDQLTAIHWRFHIAGVEHALPAWAFDPSRPTWAFGGGRPTPHYLNAFALPVDGQVNRPEVFHAFDLGPGPPPDDEGGGDDRA